MLQSEITNAVNQVSRLYGNSSAPITVHIHKSAEVRPKIELLSHEYEESKKSYDLEISILDAIQSELNPIVIASKIPEDNKRNLITYIENKITMYKSVLNRKYSID